MPVYGDPLTLHVQAMVFLSISEALKGTDKRRSARSAAREALQYVRTAIIHVSILTRRRKRIRENQEFSLIAWCHFKCDPRFRDKKTVLALMRTLRRIRKDHPVTDKARAAAVAFFDRLSDECSTKGTSSSMTIGESDD